MPETVLYRVKLKGVPPSKKNSRRNFRNKYTGKQMSLPSENYVEWEKQAVAIFRTAMTEKQMWFVNCTLTVVVSDPSKRIYDLSNKFESIADALVKAEIIKDDNRFVVTRQCTEQVEDAEDYWIVEIRGQIAKKEPKIPKVTKARKPCTKQRFQKAKRGSNV